MDGVVGGDLRSVQLPNRYGKSFSYQALSIASGPDVRLHNLRNAKRPGRLLPGLFRIGVDSEVHASAVVMAAGHGRSFLRLLDDEGLGGE
jgi:hypothetical protein